VKIAIKDANVLIDLEVAELFDLWFQLGHETMTTDLIVAELRKGRHLRALEYVRAGHIRVESCQPDFLAESFALMQEIGGGPSIEDCTVLLLAMQRDAMLLSGDKPLRIAAQTRQIEVHGTLWIFDQLVESRLMRKAIAAQKLSHLLESDRYLPAQACSERIRKWTVR